MRKVHLDQKEIFNRVRGSLVPEPNRDLSVAALLPEKPPWTHRSLCSTLVMLPLAGGFQAWAPA